MLIYVVSHGQKTVKNNARESSMLVWKFGAKSPLNYCCTGMKITTVIKINNNSTTNILNYELYCSAIRAQTSCSTSLCLDRTFTDSGINTRTAS